MSRRVRLLALVFVAGCESAGVDFCEAAGICDPALAAAPEELVILCDATPGSTCGLATLGPIVDAVLSHAVERPGSTIAIRTVGPDEETSPEIASVVVPEPPRRVRSLERHREQVTSELRAELFERAAPTIETAAEQRASSIAAALTLLGRARRRALVRWVIIASDLRERSRPFLDLETRQRVVTAEAFVRLLERRGLLGPATFGAADRVLLLDLGLPMLPGCRRCPAGIRRSDELRAIWMHALQRAGAADVAMQGRVPVFESNPNTTSATPSED